MVRYSSEFEALRGQLKFDPSGILTLNSQPMILLPRHFFRYILREVNAVAGPDAFRKILHQAGHDGAVTFCRRFQEIHGSTPQETVEGYLKEMSLRGWGRFNLVRLKAETGHLEVILENSAVAGEEGLPSGDVIWEGAMLGAMTFLQQSSGTPPQKPARVGGEQLPGDHDGIRRFRIVVSSQQEGNIIP